mmetsp:Transcript_50505/g.146811  ORF Transcript_50505/g.146811 Transcript_50505/m.146811 type:complete len:252 (+) Transcript_50505:110-865(+)
MHVIHRPTLAATAMRQQSTLLPEKVGASQQQSLFPLSGGLDLLRRRGEGHGHPVEEHERLVVLRHGLVHERAVAIPRDMGLEALVRRAPGHTADLAAAQIPMREAVELAAESHGILRSHEIDERVAEGGMGAEVDREIKEVVPALKALRIDQVHKVVAAIVVGEIPQHDRRPCFRRLQAWGGSCVRGRNCLLRLAAPNSRRPATLAKATAAFPLRRSFVGLHRTGIAGKKRWVLATERSGGRRRGARRRQQ